jgi:hypothetical protein
MLSSLMIQPTLRFPGALGAYLGESFAVLTRLNGSWGRQVPGSTLRNESSKDSLRSEGAYQGKLSLRRLMRRLDEMLQGKL